MPRGRKKRVLQCHPPPRGHYMVDWIVNELLSLNALSGPALSLWLHLKGLAWERGLCDPTDARLAELLGGVTTEMVRLARRELRGRRLLLEYGRPGAAERWLIPLPVLTGLHAGLPAEIGAAAAEAEAQLRQMLAQLRGQAAGPQPGAHGDSPQVEFGANSICSKLVLKEEEGKYPGEVYLPPPPERVNATARDNAEGGAGGGRIHPKPDWGPIQLGANSTGSEIAAAPADAERAELTEFLVAHGAFASVAAGLVDWLLAHKSVEEAKIYALAHLRAVQEGENPRGQRLQGEQAIGRWVARLREHARAPEWALDQAARELADGDDLDEEVLDEVEDLDEDPPAAEEEDPPSASPVEPAPPLPTLLCGVNGDACELTVAELWRRALGQLHYQLPAATWDAWLRDSRGADLAGDALVVEVGNRYAAEWLDLRLRPLIGRTLRGLVGREVAVEFRVGAGAGT